ncbi:MAG: hypothetical protein KQJ78_23140 [Deltaproteobacteria bacterium]|nr:hypothetical protein [Deltaproteobacteria bacterium]
MTTQHTTIRVFDDVGGYYICDDDGVYYSCDDDVLVDTRGPAYPTKAQATRMALEYAAQDGKREVTLVGSGVSVSAARKHAAELGITVHVRR